LDEKKGEIPILAQPPEAPFSATISQGLPCKGLVVSDAKLVMLGISYMPTAGKSRVFLTLCSLLFDLSSTNEMTSKRDMRRPDLGMS
jgi:hypothetical protein